MKYSYWFEDSFVTFTDHALTVRELYPLMKKHGFLVGYTEGDKVVLMEDTTCGYCLR